MTKGFLKMEVTIAALVRVYDKSLCMFTLLMVPLVLGKKPKKFKAKKVPQNLNLSIPKNNFCKTFIIKLFTPCTVSLHLIPLLAHPLGKHICSCI